MGRFYRMIFGLLAMGSMSMAQAQYCPLSGLCDDFVESLTCNNLTYAGTAGQCITTGGYEYLNDTIYLDPAQPTTIDITIGTYLDTRVVGWFDANSDEVFDAQERIEFLTTAVLGMHTGLLAASPVAADTVTRLRIVLYLAVDVIDPCNGATLFGVYQVIDIPVRITSDPAPSNPSTPAYCAASGDCGAAGAAAITNVTLIGDANTSINNNSGCDNYGDYTNLQATVSAGQTYDISIAGGNNLLGIAGVYVDWNDNGSFDDPGEFFAGVNVLPPYAAVIIPPLVGTTGLKRMRVRTTALLNTPDACGELDLGEVEDYTLYYVNPNAPLPQCIDENTSFPQDSATTCQSFIFRWSPVTDATGYRFSLIDSMNVLVNEVSLTDTSYQVVNPLTTGRTYRWVVVPFNDNGNALGCDTLTFFVAPNADPTVSILPADSIDVCRGVDLALDGNPQNGTPAFTHLWTALNGGVLDATNAQQVLFTGSNPLGTYRFSYLATDANGCSASDTVLINVQPPASAGSANAQPGQICSGQTTNFQVSNSIGTISWESGPTAAGPWTTASLTDNGMGLFTTDVLTADIYFRYTATLGVCSETSSALFIEVLPIPAKPIVLADSLVGCEGNGIVLRTVNYSEDIVWNDDQPTVNDSLEVFQTGFYVATTTGLCPSASDSVFVTINPSPQKPSVSALGGSTKCDNEAFTLISSAVGNNIWSTGETTDTIVFVSDGAVTVAQVNAFGCQT
ncbi:MAG TPA: GEVED domain-containing protein, partial [Luteibaculaceae bacterium]|nr:GEVED domain-containing protein [Luteibaculaceae bacterium]